MKVLNAFCGLGGNRRLWPEDVHVTGVDSHPEVLKQYANLHPGDEVICCDAYRFIEAQFASFDFIWASPPCQTHSRLARANCRTTPKFPDFRLYELIIFLRTWLECPFVVENVVPFYRPLVPGFKIGRHMFWSNRYIPQLSVDSDSALLSMSLDELRKELRMESVPRLYLDNHCGEQVFRNCVHPELGLKILEVIREEEYVDDWTDTQSDWLRSDFCD